MKKISKMIKHIKSCENTKQVSKIKLRTDHIHHKSGKSTSCHYPKILKDLT